MKVHARKAEERRADIRVGDTIQWLSPKYAEDGTAIKEELTGIVMEKLASQYVVHRNGETLIVSSKSILRPR